MSTTPPSGPEARVQRRPSMTELIARSSLGSRDAVAARRRVRADVAARIVEQAARRPVPVRNAPTRPPASARAQDVGGKPE